MRRHPHERHPGDALPVLWGERELVSVANLTRRDAEEFFPIAADAGVRTHTPTYPLADANEAFDRPPHRKAQRRGSARPVSTDKCYLCARSPSLRIRSIHFERFASLLAINPKRVSRTGLIRGGVGDDGWHQGFSTRAT